MKPIDIYRLLFRFIGLVGLLYICRHIYHVIHKTGSWHLGWLIHEWNKTGRLDRGEVRVLFFDLLLIAFGLYLLRGAPLLMKFFFPENTKDASDQDKSAVEKPDPTKR